METTTRIYRVVETQGSDIVLTYGNFCISEDSLLAYLDEIIKKKRDCGEKVKEFHVYWIWERFHLEGEGWLTVVSVCNYHNSYYNSDRRIGFIAYNAF